MRWILTILFLISFGLTIYGFFIKPDDVQGGHLFIGIGVCVFFFVWMPVFLYYRWKDRNAKDYMLSKENLKKMREFNDKKP